MSDAYEIGQTFRRVVDEHRKFPFKDYTDPHSSWIISAASFLENCFPNSVLVLCKIRHPEVAYVSANSEAVVGYSSQHLSRMSPQEYFDLVHPEDQKSVLRLYERMEKHTRSEDYRPENWKFAFHYRLRLRSGYINVHDEKAAFLHTSGEYIHYSLLSITDNVSALTTPYMALHKKVNNTFKIIDSYVPQGSNEHLTRREQEVLQCLDAGLNTKEIAETLSISPFTIRNHKTNLFKKTKAKTGLQAVRNARKLRWI